MGEMLSVKDINVYYGSIHAIRDVSFHVNEGEIVTLIGANGAGKTTTMHAISGLLKLRSGEIDYCGHTISKMEAHKIIRLGLAQVPEGRRVFSGLTVQQNLMLGAYTRRDGKEAIQNDFDMVYDLLPRLKERRSQAAGTLFALTDADGNPIAAFSPAKSYQTVLISAPDLKTGESYTLYTGGTGGGTQTNGLYTAYTPGEKLTDVTLSDMVTSISDNGGAAAEGMGGFGGGMGGRPGRR